MSYEDDLGLDDWDDPFAGDFDLDGDFDIDPFKGKGFVSSMASGFLGGLVNETVGSGAAITRSLRTILPNTFSNAFDRTNRAIERYDELKTELKEQNYESVRSLQSIAGQLSNRFGEKLPGGLRNKMDDFSQKDFSDWEKSDGSYNSMEGIEEESDYDLTLVLDSVMSRQEGLFSEMTNSLNVMSANVGGQISSAVMAGNRQLVNIETSVRDLNDYQRNVQFKIEQTKLNLMAKGYVANVKYYKFMEKGMHAQVAELKKILKGTMMSDYQKTSNFTASKQYMRDSLFSTVGRRVGGLTGLIRDRFGKEARQDASDSASSVLGMVADMLEMSDGMPVSAGMLGDMAGRGLAGAAVRNLPNFFARGPGKRMLESLAKKNPAEAKALRRQWGRLSNTGSKASYMSNAGVGLINFMAEDYQAMDEMPFIDYEDYVASLPPDKQPMSKARWTIQNAASNRAKAAMNSFMSEMNQAKGTQYTLKKRNPRDLVDAGIWTQGNNVTLNEVIPGLISRTNQLLEMIRTGDSNAELVTYNYMRGQFQNETNKQIAVQADLMPAAEFDRYATAALEFVDDLDPKKTLSQGARKAFAKVIARDVDREKNFNPFYYIGDIPGISGPMLDEIHAVVRRHFGLRDQDIARFNETTGFERMQVMTEMRNSRYQERLNKAGSAATNLKDLAPNIAERIDMLRATGNEQLLRDLGVIYTENGIDKVDMEVFHERIGMFMDDPNNPALRGMNPSDKTQGKKTRNSFHIPDRPAPTNDGKRTEGASFAGLSSSLNTLTEKLDVLASSNMSSKSGKPDTAYMDTQTGEIVSNTSKIAESNQRMETILSSLLDLANKGKLFSGAPKNANEERQEEQAKEGLMSKIKGLFPEGMFGRGMDLLVKNSPIVLGGVLGGIASNFASNPIAAASMAVGGLALGGLVQYWGNKDRKEKVSANEPSDDEDIVDENGESILKSAKLKAGEYIDAITKRVINTYREIKGPVIDVVSKAIITVRELGGRIFGPDGRAVVLRGIETAKGMIVNAYNFVNPIGKLRAGIDMGKEIIYQQDVFVKGDLQNPRLRAVGFKNVEYWKDENGTFKPVKGWNEISGPVYDEEGNELISQAEFDEGLVTRTGQRIRQVGTMGSNMAGAAVGMGKQLFTNMMGKLGFERSNEQASSHVSAVRGRGTNMNGVERRLDRIYKLLSQKFGMEIEDEELDDAGGPAMRKNSLEDKARQAAASQSDRVQKAIIDIGDTLTGKSKKKGEGEEKGKKPGLFGKLYDMMGSIGGFFKNPLGSLLGMVGGSMAASVKRLGTIGSALFSGVLGIGSPIFKLLSGGIKMLGGLLGPIAKMAGSGIAGLFGMGGPGGRGGKLNKGMGRVGALVGGSALAYNLLTGDDSSSTPTEENMFNQKRPVTTADQIEDAANWIPQIGIGTTVLEAVMPKSWIDGIKNTGVYWTDDGQLFTDRRDAEQHMANSEGYKYNGTTYRTTLLANSIQKRLRFAMYGIREWRSDLAERVQRLEMMLLPHVNVGSGSAGFSKPEAVAEVFRQFVENSAPIPRDNINTWFQARFKPIFLTFVAAANAARFGDLQEYDAGQTHEVVLVAERVQEAVGHMSTNPYTIDVPIDQDTGTMSRIATTGEVADLMNELRKAYPAEKKADGLKLRTYDEQRQANLNPEVSDNKVVAWFQNKFGNESLIRSQEHIDKTFAVTAEIKDIDISDLHKDGDTEIEPFTLARLAVYGNDANINWRVDAVLKLERYCEENMVLSNGLGKLEIPLESVLALFKPMFRIKTELMMANWKAWFESRFLPVLQKYYALVYKQRGSSPKQGWRQLSNSNKAEIAKVLSEIMVMVDGEETSVWNVKASPFEGAQSGTDSDRADTYIKSLNSDAMKAALRDPVMEEAASKAIGEQLQDKSEARKQAEQARIAELTAMRMKRREQAGKQGGTFGGNNYASNGFANAFPPGGMGTTPGTVGAGSGGQYSGGFSEGWEMDPTLKAGDDQGLSMTPEQGEQLLLQGLLRAGITDNKQIALALALAKVETGNYKSTVENTNWSAPTLKKYFRNIPDMATAEKVAAMPPEQRAMYVYGRAPKGPTLGNEKPEDGWLYRGRGLFQLTGKANYEKYKRETGIDVVSNPRLVSEDPNVVADSAVRYLLGNKAIKSIATTGDFDSAVRGINGGNSVPFTDERRKAYTEYLAKLQNGQIKAAGPTKTSDFAPTSGGEDKIADVPNAADQNVPKAAEEKVASTKKTHKQEFDELLDKSSVNQQKAATASPPVSPSAAPTAAVTNPVPSPAPVQAPTPKPSAPAPVSQPAGPTTVSSVGPAPKPAPKQTGTGTQAVSDEGAQQLLSGIISQLGRLNDLMASQGKGGRPNTVGLG
ncbi:hypothetical protein D9_0062 [Aeromonas phage D9]|nr:hypothetical protein D9_0062 [Aeromonas phage D9]